MMAVIKYELIKLFSIRSTYGAVVLALAFSVLISVFSVIEYKGMPGQLDGITAARVMLDAPFVAAQVGTIIAMLIMLHEYRYNMIMYTLTACRSRSRVLLSKIAVVALFSAGLVLACAALGLIVFYIGFALRGISVPDQTFNVLTTLAKSVTFGVGFGLAGLLIATITRNIVFSIVTFFMLIGALEPLLGNLVLKDNAVYLPFTALSNVLVPPGQPVLPEAISPLMGGLVFFAYLVVGWIVAWVLFLRRDAN